MSIYDAPHAQRGIEQAEADAKHYRINGKSPAEHLAERHEQERLRGIAAMLDGDRTA